MRSVQVPGWLLIGGGVVAVVAGVVWWSRRKAKAAAAQQQQSTVSATAPAPVPYGVNMPGVVDVVQGPPGTTTRVTNLQTGERVV